MIEVYEQVEDDVYIQERRRLEIFLVLSVIQNTFVSF